MAKITNITRRRVMLPTGLVIAVGETVTVENIDILRPDNWPALQCHKANRELTWDLDPEPPMEESADAANGITAPAPHDEPAPAAVPALADASAEVTEPSPETAAVKPSKK